MVMEKRKDDDEGDGGKMELLCVLETPVESRMRGDHHKKKKERNEKTSATLMKMITDEA